MFNSQYLVENLIEYKQKPPRRCSARAEQRRGGVVGLEAYGALRSAARP